MSRNRSRVGRLVILGVACFAPAVARAQTSYPMLLRVDPVAVRRHCPDKSGYLESSNADATEIDPHSAAAHRTATIVLR